MKEPDESKTHWISLIEAFAPEQMSAFRSSPNEALRLTRHAEARVRAAAIMAGHAIWRLLDDVQFVKRCCDIAATDEHEEPRHTAIAVLALGFEDSRNRYVQRALAQVLRDESASAFLRNAAYRAILDVEHENDGLEDLTTSEAEVRAAMSGHEVRLAEIDWDFIDRLCKTDPGAACGRPPLRAETIATIDHTAAIHYTIDSGSIVPIDFAVTLRKWRILWAGITVFSTMVVGFHDGWTWTTLVWMLETIAIGQARLPEFAVRINARLRRSYSFLLAAMFGSAFSLGAPIGVCVGVLLPVIYRLDFPSYLSGMLGLLIGPCIAAFYGLVAALFVSVAVWIVSCIRSIAGVS